MPTITQLPLSSGITSADILPISQDGSTCAVSIGTLLAGTQPAILIENASLLGRMSIGPGSPEQVAVGFGLAMSGGTLIATGTDHSSFPPQQWLAPSDSLVVSSGGTSVLVPAASIRSLFSSGSNISISDAGVISATTEAATAASGPGIASLPPAPSISFGDKLAISQAGTMFSATISSILDGVTLSQAACAVPPSDTDTFWVGQDGDTMVRQTLGSLSSWLSARFLAASATVLEVTSNLTLDATLHNNTILVCSKPLVLSRGSGGSLSGFRCDVINVSSGDVTLASGVTTSSGATTLASGQSMRFYGLQYSGGNLLYAALGSTSPITSPPGSPTNLVATAVSSTSVQLSWAPPTGGATAPTYYISYRTTGTTGWTASLTGITATQYTLSGLTSGTSYDFYVSASDGAGAVAASNVATVSLTGASAQTIAVPTGLTESNISSTAVTLSWVAPASGQVQSYTLQYRISGASAWSGSVPGITNTTSTLSGLTPGQAYEWQILAIASGSETATSAAASFATSPLAQSVTSIVWNVVPSGPFSRGSGAIGINAHVNPSSAPIQFGLSTSPTVPPSIWLTATYVNTDLWGAYVNVPATVGNWYAWAQGVDGSAAIVCMQPIAVT